MAEEQFDAVVVGSGFGGSVMAYRLAAAGKTVCLLERGKAYPPGSFPRSPIEMKGNFWDPSAGMLGLFNVWSFSMIDALVSSALGGGSHIYANVLLPKDEQWFVREDLNNGGYESWPVTRKELDPHYEAVSKVLKPQRYPIESPPYNDTRKAVEFAAAARRLGLEVFHPPLAITFGNLGAAPAIGELIDEAPNLHGRHRFTCRLCGECNIGCNYGSKNTLDFNYLTMARQEGADIRVLCEVRGIMPHAAGGYEVQYVKHDPEVCEGKGPIDTARLTVHKLVAKRLILSAGTLGSTYLLLRNAANLNRLSPRLGSRFCGNGDLLSFALRARVARNGKFEGRPLHPSRGPVITTAARVPDELDDSGRIGARGHYLEDAGLPLFLAWKLQTMEAPSAIRRLATLAKRYFAGMLGLNPDSDFGHEISKYVLGPCELSGDSLPLLGMGRDTPDGVMSLRKGFLDLDWRVTRSGEFFRQLKATAKAIAHELGADFRVNPTFLLKRLITVHPLGGCPMGNNPDEGVVGPFGEVFGHPGLYVADGAVMPGPVGPNPALTIAALSDRFAERMIDEWNT